MKIQIPVNTLQNEKSKVAYLTPDTNVAIDMKEPPVFTMDSFQKGRRMANINTAFQDLLRKRRIQLQKVEREDGTIYKGRLSVSEEQLVDFAFWLEKLVNLVRHKLF